MLLESLEAQNFRNLRGQIVCGKNLNIIFGENGQGKTNWLEAIYLLATTKSFKTARLQEAIKFEEDLAIVRGNVHQGEHIDRLIQVALQGNTKTLTVNGKKVDAVAQVSKSGFVWVFERETGKPLFPIEEKPYPKS